VCTDGACRIGGATCLVDTDCNNSFCEEVGTVNIPLGSLSGTTTSQILDLVLPTLNDALVITTSGRTLIDGATGLGSPGDVVVWTGGSAVAGRIPWNTTAGGCYFCVGNTPDSCSRIALINDGFITCNQGQFGDPGHRVMPSWKSLDLGQTWQFSRLNGDENDDNIGHWDPGTESIQAGAAEQFTASNRGPLVLFGYRDHDCGTMNNPGRGLTAPGTCVRDADGTLTSGCFDTVGSTDCVRVDRPQTPYNDIETCTAGIVGPYGNPFNPAHAKSDMDCDRKVDPGIYPLAADINDPEYPDPIPLPSDLVQDVCISYYQQDTYKNGGVQLADADANNDQHGNQCSCSDQNGDYAVTVSDIVAINEAIFTPSAATLLCDGRNDSLCDVTDLIDANIEIFSPGTSSICVYNTVPSNP
jgi:hypothetical protein